MNAVSNRLLPFFAAVVTFVAPVFPSLHAAAPASTVVASNLRAPSKLLLTKQGNLLVAEAGAGPNTGRISMVDPRTGARRTLLDGLPSALAAPNNQPSGPSSLLMRGRTLFITISTGDAVVNGAAAATTVPNANPASPLFSSVLAIHVSAQVERSTGGFTLSPTDHAMLKAGSLVVLNNGRGDRLVVDRVADFVDYVPDPRPNEPNNVRASNPFGLALLDERLFVVDASMNRIWTVDLESGAVGTLTTFAPVPNTRGFGPPVVEAVPDSICVYGGQLLVTYLTGFPFPSGGAQVRLVDPDTGEQAVLITGLTSAIDVLPLDSGGLLTLEFSLDMAAPAPQPPGRLQWFEDPDAAPVVLSNTLITPTSVEYDEKSRAIYITEIFTGRILKISLPQSM
jgi:hypothetical protein